jgi:hypothetical protein
VPLPRLRSLGRCVLGVAALALSLVKPSSAGAASPYLVVPEPGVAEQSPAYRYANMSDEEAFAELDRRQILYMRVPAVPGVRAPIRLTGRLHGVYFHSSLPLEERATTIFEILDARLALTLDDFAAVLERHDIDEVVHYTMYRPNVARPHHADHDDDTKVPAVSTTARLRAGSAARRDAGPSKPAFDGKAMSSGKSTLGGKASLDANKGGRNRASGMKQKSSASLPAKTTKPPASAAQPPKAGSNPTKVAAQPTKVVESPVKVVTNPTKVAAQPPKVAAQPPKLASQPPKAAPNPTKVVSQSIKVVAQPPKIAAQPIKVVAQPTKVAAQPPKIDTQPPAPAAQPARTAAIITKPSAPAPRFKTTWAPPGTRHPAGLAIDVGLLRKRDGRWLNVAHHFQGHIGAKTCGEGAAMPEKPEARELRAIVCESADLGIFTYVLTPNYNAAHADHYHMEIKPGVRWFLYH